ncbi:MAG: multidrug transporter AcrB [Nitrospirales bacterium]|nr:MAG: multidrug transporter AcrB [Nitrospirales bacterium]
MNLAKFALQNRITILALTAVFFLGGINSFSNLAWLEDPEFTIKEALVVTAYPGAAAADVEEEVTDEIEIAVQQLAQLDEVESKSERGFSTVTVRIKDNYDKETLPQVWDELRRKVNDVQGRLPPGAGPSIVIDDFSDVYGIFIAITGSEYNYVELQDFAEMLRRELLLVDDVAKIDFWGERTEAIYVEPERDLVSQLQIVPDQILQSLQNRNVVVDSGRVQVGREYIPVEPTGEFTSTEEVGDLLLATPSSSQQIYLRDVSKIRRGYMEPRREVLRFDGKVAVGLGISTVSGGNVVSMGDAVQARLQQLLPRTPLGVEYGVVSLQSEAVSTAINGFVISLLQAIVIVIVVLLAFMGLRSGLLIGFVLAVTISATFIFMGPWEVALERISLGALIIALGMLVDNAIVVVDGMLVRIQKGMDAEDAAKEVVSQTAVPLLGATAVAIMAFGAIGLSDDSTGEFCRSLFQVVLISLSLSWVTAVTLTPVLGVMILKKPMSEEYSETKDPYDTKFYSAYRRLLRASIKAKWLTLSAVVIVFAGSLWAFGFVNQSFFPDSTRPQFMVDLWLPQGTHIDYTESLALEAEEYLLELPETSHVTSVIGAGGLRFILTYSPERPNSAYAQFLVDVEDYRVIDQLIPEVEKELTSRFPDSLVLAQRFRLGPGSSPIQARISGPDLNELRSIASQVEAALHADGGAKAIRTDWRQRTKLIRPILANDEANRIGIGRPDLAGAIKYSFEGQVGGLFREGDDLIPIVFREPEPERSNVSNLQDIQIFSPSTQGNVSIDQVVSNLSTVYEDEIIHRLNRQRTISIKADTIDETASEVFNRVRPVIEEISLPSEYSLEWWGEYRDSSRAQAGMAASMPFFLLTMVLIVIALFNSFRQPLVIWCTVPLALIGVTIGLLVTNQPFGFMALLGFMSLSGMLIKNAIVLIDEIEIQKRSETDQVKAIIDSGVSRLRPVAMAALTTALGMIPLVFDAFFVSMAVTIIFGLMIASVLTMVFVPVLYAIFFKVQVL